MGGWDVSVHRHGDTASARQIAAWYSRDGVLRWLRELVRAGDATALAGDGYPYRFTARAGVLLPAVLAGPPAALNVSVDRDVVASCTDDEWLLVVVWDAS